MIRNSSNEWGWPAKLLHWAGALIILVLLGHGWWMTHMTPRPDRLANYAWHSALGYDLFALVLLRILWRWLNPVPQLPLTLETWERLGAQAGHLALYLLMLIVSVSGWMVATTFRAPMTRELFGINVPPLVTAVGPSTREWIEGSHMVLAYVLGAVVVIHVIGALRHHYLKRNDILRRMTWRPGA